MKSSQRQTLPLHPYFLAAASVVLLLWVNKTEMDWQAAVRMTVVMLILTLVISLLVRCIFRNRHRAAFVTTAFILFFVTYGHVFNLLQANGSLKALTHHRYTFAVYTALLLLAVALIARLKKPESWTRPLNLVTGIILALPLLQVIYFYAAASLPQPAQNTPTEAEDQTTALTATAAATPDIYYIILDSYTREDQLYNDYSFDNSEFIDALRSRGFFVGDCSRSNYAHTRLSLSTSLNMNYFDGLGYDLAGDEDIPFSSLITESQVRRQLTELGYKTVAFETGYNFTEIKDADYYYVSSSNALLSPYVEPFEYLYLQSSIVRVILDTQSGLVDRYFAPLVFPFTEQEMRVKNVFQTLPQIPQIEGPKFVFVHLDIPHHPFIFLPDGTINPDHSYYPGVNMPEDINLMKQGYINQVEYVNAEVLPIVDEILANSEQPPIIILQGDHGLMVGERNDILNAIYLPDGVSDMLYSSITPVNTFRVIFDEYFGGDYPLLDDVSYYSSYDDKQDVRVVEETARGCTVK